MDPTDEYEIVDINSTMETSYSAGIHEIDSNLLIRVSGLLARPLHDIFEKVTAIGNLKKKLKLSSSYTKVVQQINLKVIYQLHFQKFQMPYCTF